ncbi:MAG: transcription elongation factor GreA [Chloroflexi bacterium]|nr:transcription elongation factor GreA [Chloroflexota bacterium]
MAVQRRPRGITAQQALEQFLGTLPLVVRQESREELGLLVGWFGEERPLKELTPAMISTFTKTFGPQAPDLGRRLTLLRSFLTYLHHEGLVTRDLSAAVQLQAEAWSQTRMRAARPKGLGTVRLTPEGYEQLQAELEALKAQRPRLAEELQEARSGMPLDDAPSVDWVRHYQSLQETRIGELEAILKRAEVIQIEEVPEGQAVLGSTVVLRDLATNQTLRFQLVDSPESNPSQGKISAASPTGQAVLGHRPGDDVEVHAPIGTIRYRIEHIEGWRGPRAAAA